MSIAIIIGTHGSVSEHLLKAVEMILGKQENVSGISFFSGENSETLVRKYTEKLAELNATMGALFMVDIWGGSPFNAASRIAVNKDNVDVVTGVNIPMLTETFMARDENPSLQELVKVAIESGSLSIKAFKCQKSFVKKTMIPVSNVLSSNPEDHMIIALARIDDRLIHGQIVTRWTKETNITRIIVVSDEVAADKVRNTLLKQVAPPGVTAHVVDVDKAIRVYSNPKYAKDRVMLLFTNPTDVLRLVDNGVKIISVNIGGMAFHQGKKQVNNAVSVDQKDIEAFEKLNKQGIKLEVRKVPSDSPLNMMDLIKKIDK